MSDRLLTREWVAIGIVLGAILTTLIVSKISEKRIYNLLQKALSEASEPANGKK